MDCYTIKKAFSWVSFGLGHRPLSICILHGLTLIKMHNNATPQNFLKRRYAASFFLTSRLTSKKPTERAVLTNQGELRSSPIGTNRARFPENTSHLSSPGHEKLGQRPAVNMAVQYRTRGGALGHSRFGGVCVTTTATTGRPMLDQLAHGCPEVHNGRAGPC